MAPSRLTPAESLKARREFLQTLYDADVNAKTDDERWMNIYDIECKEPNIVYKNLRDLDLLDVRFYSDPFSKSRVQVRINQFGKWALQNGKFFYKDLLAEMRLPAPLKGRLDAIAKELGLESTQELLRRIAGREDAFKRWIKFVYSDEGG